MIPYTYTYLFGTVLFMVPWVILYNSHKSLRQEMMYISIFGAIMSVITGYFWLTYDWWKPDTLTNTRVGFEDLLLGFGNGGVGAVLYQFIFKKEYNTATTKRRLYIILLVVFILISMSVLIWGFNWSSFNASFICMTVVTFCMFILRKDLIQSAIVNGVAMVILSLPVYLLCEWVSPGWINRVWYVERLSNIYIRGIPIEDLIFYFQSGTLSFLFYKIWFGVTLT